MVHAAQLIVLGSTKVGERTLVLHTLSSLWGRRGFLVTTGKGAAASLFLPLNILDAEVVENPKSDLWRLRSIRSLYPLSGIRNDVRKNTVSLFMSEVLFRAVREGECEAGLFDWCRRSILTLDSLRSDYSNFHLLWLLELAGALGFSPTAEGLAPFAGDLYKEVLALLQSDFPGAMLLPLSGRIRSQIADALLQYIGFHAEISLEVRSLSVLRDLYS